MLPFNTLKSIAVVGLLVIVIVLAVSSNLWPQVKSVLGIDVEFEEELKKVERDSVLIFNDLEESITKCVESRENGCFCSKKNIIFPTDYSIHLFDRPGLTSAELRNSRDQVVSKFDFQERSCVILGDRSDSSKGDRTNLNRKLNDDKISLLYGGSSIILYKNEDFTFFPNLVWYSNENGRICVLNDFASDVLRGDQVCRSEEHSKEIQELIDEGTSESFLQLARIYSESSEYKLSANYYHKVMEEFPNSNEKDLAKQELDNFLTSDLDKIIFSEDNLGGLTSEEIISTFFVTRFKEGDQINANVELHIVQNLRKMGLNDDEIQAYLDQSTMEYENLIKKYERVYSHLYLNKIPSKLQYFSGKAAVPRHLLDEITTSPKPDGALA